MPSETIAKVAELTTLTFEREIFDQILWLTELILYQILLLPAMKNALSFVILLYLYAKVYLSTPAGAPSGTRCQQVRGAPSCVCTSPSGLIDLTKVASYNGTPR